jgi:hypothetical protein
MPQSGAFPATGIETIMNGIPHGMVAPNDSGAQVRPIGSAPDTRMHIFRFESGEIYVRYPVLQFCAQKMNRVARNATQNDSNTKISKYFFYTSRKLPRGA